MDRPIWEEEGKKNRPPKNIHKRGREWENVFLSFLGGWRGMFVLLLCYSLRKQVWKGRRQGEGGALIIQADVHYKEEIGE